MPDFNEVFTQCNQEAARAVFDASEDGGFHLPPPGSYTGRCIGTECRAYKPKGHDNSFPMFMVNLEVITASDHPEAAGDVANVTFRLGPTPGQEGSIEAGQLKGFAGKLLGSNAKAMPVDALVPALEQALPGLAIEFRVQERNGYLNAFLNNVLAQQTT